MKFTLALVGAAAATSETGIKMLQKLNTMDQSMENIENVKVALVSCAAAGDCSAEAAAMPALAMATVEATADADATAVKTKEQDAVANWKLCINKATGDSAAKEKTCAKEKLAAFNNNAV